MNLPKATSQAFSPQCSMDLVDAGDRPILGITGRRARRCSFQGFEEIGGEAQGGLTDGVFGGDDV